MEDVSTHRAKPAHHSPYHLTYTPLQNKNIQHIDKNTIKLIDLTNDTTA
ncbi:hypothetical protein C8N47_12410 [Mangrovibacterium marinum]|uniref:Uncharacterized protein n=1 Tax=Mangrovibacterium marinum TaxID=1639118 RepID=A0A2T5BXW8_9BACT|nr:hypothetical protein C8N47_12410 [Mangrovibacterium marinum]